MQIRVDVKYSIGESDRGKIGKIIFMLPCEHDSKYLISDLICSKYFIDDCLTSSWGTVVELDGKYWRRNCICLYSENWTQLVTEVKERVEKKVSEINEIYQQIKSDKATTPTNEAFTIELGDETNTLWNQGEQK
jgi:hypothetical protein